MKFREANTLAATLFALAAPVGAQDLGAAFDADGAGCVAAEVPSLGDRPAVFVATDGNDGWSGTLDAPAPDGSDGPLATLSAARDRARDLAGPARIVVRGGDYYLSAPLELDERDRGLAIVGASGEQPVLHGGLPLARWQQGDDGRWWASFERPDGSAPGDVFVGGRRQTLARHPNLPVDGDATKGWLFAAAQTPEVAAAASRAFAFHDGDVPALDDIAGLRVDIVGGLLPGTQWSNDTLPVVGIDRAARTIRTEGTDYFFTSEGSRYFLSGAAAFWDAPGEWWYDAATARVGYIPTDANFAGRNAAVAGFLPTLVHVVGAEGVVISGIAFRDGSPVGTGGYGTYKQGGGAVRIEGSGSVQVTGNSFENVGVAVHVSESSRALVACNAIRHVAGNGVYVGTSYGSFGRSDDVRILGNTIADIGEVYLDAAGVWFQAADRIRIAGNRIENVPQCGIVGGSVWGPQDASHDAIIERNTVIGANRRTADGGAIKLMGAQSDPMGSVIRDNIVVGTDELMNRADGSFWPAHYENTEEWPGPISWAIYLDGRASGVTISGNLLRDNIAGIGINGGWSNLVTGNVITGGYGAAFRIDDATGRGWRPEWAEANRVESNVVTTEREPGRTVEVNAPDHGGDYVRFDRNAYIGPLSGRSFRYSPGMFLYGEVGGFEAFRRAGEEAGGTWVPDTRPVDAGE